MRKRRLALVLGLLCLGALTVLASDPSSQPAASHPFDPGRYLAHVKYLSSDELGGRLPGTAGIELAAEYIAKQFAACGLTPAGENGTFFQPFEVRRGKKIVDELAELRVEGVDRTWQVRRDWIPLPFTEMADVEGPLAFAGYGIRTRLYEYDDYENFDPRGKVLLIFRYEPLADDPEADFGGQEPSRYSLFSRKARTAHELGAKALLIVNPPLRKDLPDTLYEFNTEFSERTFDLPMVHVTRELAESLVQKAGLGSLAELQQKLDRERKALSADLNLTISIKLGVQPNRITTRNVLGLLRGREAPDETIVVGAHYDHLGRIIPPWGRHDDTPQVHNGADDNASGTAGVIEMARALAAEQRPRRSVLFIAFSAEEMGLLGSEHFLAHPTVPADGLRAMINFDMIGRLGDQRLTVFGTRSAAEFAALMERCAAAVGLEYRAARGIAGNSDHFTFYSHNVPVLFAFTGVHKQYHQPDDDWELIDAVGATRILAAFLPVVRELADLPGGPTFQTDDAEPEPDDVQMKPAVEHDKEAEQAADSQPAESHEPHAGGEVEKASRPPVRLGIVPDVSGGDEPGLVAVSVLEGSAAQAAGMQDGDRIIRIGPRQIKDIYGYMDALRECQPGQTVDVVVVRKGQELTIKVKLQEAAKPKGQQ